MMGDDRSPRDSGKQAQVRTNAESGRRRDPKRLRDLMVPLLDLDEDVDNLQNLDKMLANRFAQFHERRKQLQAMRNEDERQIVIEMLDQEKTAAGVTEMGCPPAGDGDMISPLCTPHKIMISDGGEGLMNPEEMRRGCNKTGTLDT